MEYLSEEDQFRDVLNDEEISRIKNPEIRRIREKYWVLQKKAFLDEHGISGIELNKVSKELRQREQKELQRFKDY